MTSTSECNQRDLKMLPQRVTEPIEAAWAEQSRGIETRRLTVAFTAADRHRWIVTDGSNDIGLIAEPDGDTDR